MLRYCVGIMLMVAVGVAQADALDAEISRLAGAWDVANFATAGEAKEKALAGLAEQAQRLREIWPERAEPLIWEGIVLASWAGAKGGLGALKLAKQARDQLLRAEQIDPSALNGSVYTSLGSLYYQVPGWPLGFGDDDKAREYLEKALTMNPDGIDPNFFYGDYLIAQGDYARAVAVLERALQAPQRPGRDLADRGRRAEIEKAMRTAKDNIGTKSW